MQYLCQIIEIPDMQKTLIENTAITIGRLGLLCPGECAGFINSFINNWCQSLKEIRANDEKYTSFLGLVHMLHQNPSVLQNNQNFIMICMAITSWEQPPEDLHTYFKEILKSVVDKIEPNEWAMMKTFHMIPAVKARLEYQYQL